MGNSSENQLIFNPASHHENLCWNSHGLGNPRRVHVLHDIILRGVLDVVFLMETKSFAQNMKFLNLSLEFYGCLVVNNK